MPAWDAVVGRLAGSAPSWDESSSKRTAARVARTKSPAVQQSISDEVGEGVLDKERGVAHRAHELVERQMGGMS